MIITDEFYKYNLLLDSKTASVMGYNDTYPNGIPNHNMVIPSSVTYNGETYIVESIMNTAFGNNIYTENIKENIKTCVLPDTIKYIGLGAFSERGIEKLNIGNSIISGHLENTTSSTMGKLKNSIEISNRAFNNNKLTELTFNNYHNRDRSIWLHGSSFANNFLSGVLVIPDNVILNSEVFMNNNIESLVYLGKHKTFLNLEKKFDDNLFRGNPNFKTIYYYDNDGVIRLIPSYYPLTQNINVIVQERMLDAYRSDESWKSRSRTINITSDKTLNNKFGFYSQIRKVGDSTPKEIGLTLYSSKWPSKELILDETNNKAFGMKITKISLDSDNLEKISLKNIDYPIQIEFGPLDRYHNLKHIEFGPNTIPTDIVRSSKHVFEESIVPYAHYIPNIISQDLDNNNYMRKVIQHTNIYSIDTPSEYVYGAENGKVLLFTSSPSDGVCTVDNSDEVNTLSFKSTSLSVDMLTLILNGKVKMLQSEPNTSTSFHKNKDVSPFTLILNSDLDYKDIVGDFKTGYENLNASSRIYLKSDKIESYKNDILTHPFYPDFSKVYPIEYLTLKNISMSSKFKDGNPFSYNIPSLDPRIKHEVLPSPYTSLDFTFDVNRAQYSEAYRSSSYKPGYLFEGETKTFTESRHPELFEENSDLKDIFQTEYILSEIPLRRGKVKDNIGILSENINTYIESNKQKYEFINNVIVNNKGTPFIFDKDNNKTFLDAITEYKYIAGVEINPNRISILNGEAVYQSGSYRYFRMYNIKPHIQVYAKLEGIETPVKLYKILTSLRNVKYTDPEITYYMSNINKRMDSQYESGYNFIYYLDTSYENNNIEHLIFRGVSFDNTSDPINPTNIEYPISDISQFR